MRYYSILLVFLGAGLGAVLRYFFNLVFLPYGPLVSNIFGCFLMGLFMGIIKSQFPISELWQLFITTGFLGGLTTFSAFTQESMTFLYSSNYVMGMVNILLHVVGALFSTLLGILAIKIVVS